MNIVTVGIDPGLKGGIAWTNGFGVSTAVEMPDTTGKRISLLKDIYNSAIEKTATEPHVYIEQVQVMGKVFGAKAALSYGQAYGEIIGAMMTLGYRITEVRASVWKKKLNLSKDKNESIALCEKEFPSIELCPGRKVKPHDGIAEAACIMLYGQRYK